MSSECQQVGSRPRDLWTTDRGYSGCGKISCRKKLKTCSRCKVFVYCNRDCQLLHWKNGHRETCKAQKPLPPVFSITKFDFGNDPDLDTPYNFIVMNPWDPSRTGVELISSVEGFGGDCTYLNRVREAGSVLTLDTFILEGICSQFNWPSGYVGTVSIPGFTSGYNGIHLRALCDDSFRNLADSLRPNHPAGILTMCGPYVARGIFVLFATSYDSETDEYVATTLTRRGILAIMSHVTECGEMNAVPQRVHFENLSRAESVLAFKQLGGSSMTL